MLRNPQIHPTCNLSQLQNLFFLRKQTVHRMFPGSEHVCTPAKSPYWCRGCQQHRNTAGDKLQHILLPLNLIVLLTANAFILKSNLLSILCAGCGAHLQKTIRLLSNYVHSFLHLCAWLAILHIQKSVDIILLPTNCFGIYHSKASQWD